MNATLRLSTFNFPKANHRYRTCRTPRTAFSLAAIMKLAGISPLCLMVVLHCLTSSAGTLTLDIRPVVATQPLLVDSLRYRNAHSEAFSVTRLSTILGGFALERRDGTFIGLTNQYGWIDATRRRTTFTLTNLPPGQYRSLRFHVGPDPVANKSDPARRPANHPLNPNLNGLHWNWQGGYIFLALEGQFRDRTNQLHGYSFHFAKDANRTRIDLAGKWDLRHHARALIDLDLAALLNAPRPISFTKDGHSTHSNQDDPLTAAIKGNLPGAFRLRRIESIGPQRTRPSPSPPLYLPKKITPYPFRISARFPIPSLPADNPLLVERVALGRRLFHDPRLSRDHTVTCASCHLDKAALTDPRRYSIGVDGRTGTRNAMPIFNLAWKSEFFWDGRAPSLRAQALMPIQDHLEMDESLTNVIRKLAADADYPAQFAKAFQPADITPEKIGLAIENFVLTLTSFDSRFDRAMRGAAKFSEQEKRGFELFMTEYEPRTGRQGADCFHCHGGALFTDHQFHNNGLPIRNADTGREKVTRDPHDRARFSTPSLHNIALTAPYMHDGRFETLEEVIDHYTTGIQRTQTLDPNLAKHPTGGIPLKPEDKRALIAFLRTLTDEKFQPSGNR